MSFAQNKLSADKNDEVLTAIASAINALQQQSGYGSIEITIHDGRVTQIERREKLRFEIKPESSRKSF